MSRAQFEGAEEHFRTYIYVAPDQANPHDSMAELYALLGRYDEARAEDELALEERPDFCASYVNLIGIAVLEGDAAEARGVVDRARTHCSAEMIRVLDCDVRILSAYFEKDPDRPWREGFADCSGKAGKGGPIFYRLALLSGRTEVADAERAALSTDLAADESRMGYKGRRRRLQIQLDHADGLRALLAGDNEEAVARFQAADSRANYWGASDGRFKMFNLHHLALALERANRQQEAERAIAEIAKVNPAFASAHDRVVQDLDRRR
jgi:Flp pilus assembly protein TadD